MIISRLGQYTIQALVYIGLQEKGTPILCRVIAERLGVPGSYITKIMNALCKAGMMASSLGRNGGYYLQQEASEINIMKVLMITEGVDFTMRCVMGLNLHGDKTFCPMHEKWVSVKTEITAMLLEQNVAMLAEAVRDGRYYLTDLPGALYPNQVATGKALGYLTSCT